MPAPVDSYGGRQSVYFAFESTKPFVFTANCAMELVFLAESNLRVRTPFLEGYLPAGIYVSGGMMPESQTDVAAHDKATSVAYLDTWTSQWNLIVTAPEGWLPLSQARQLLPVHAVLNMVDYATGEAMQTREYHGSSEFIQWARDNVAGSLKHLDLPLAATLRSDSPELADARLLEMYFELRGISFTGGARVVVDRQHECIRITNTISLLETMESDSSRDQRGLPGLVYIVDEEPGSTTQDRRSGAGNEVGE